MTIKATILQRVLIIFFAICPIQIMAQTDSAPSPGCRLFNAIQQGMTIVDIQKLLMPLANQAQFQNYKIFRWKFPGGATVRAYIDQDGAGFPVETTNDAIDAKAATDPQMILFNGLLAKHSLNITSANATFGMGELLGYRFKILLPKNSYIDGKSDVNGQITTINLTPGCQGDMPTTKSFQTAILSNGVASLNLHAEPDDNARVLEQITPNKADLLNLVIVFKSADWGSTTDPQTKIASFKGWGKAVDTSNGTVGWIKNRDITILPERYHHLDNANPFIHLPTANPVYASPESDKPQATLPAQASVSIVYKKGNWWQVVDPQGRIGWLNASTTPFLTLYSGPDINSKPLAELKLADLDFNIILSVKDWSEVFDPISAQIGWVQTNILNTMNIKSAVYASYKPAVLNKAITLYTEPNTDSNVVTKVEPGQSVTFLYSKSVVKPAKKVVFVKLAAENITWWRTVDSKGQSGWVTSEQHDKALATK